MIIKLVARSKPSTVMKYCSPMVAILLMLAGWFIIFASLGKDPIQGFSILFLKPLSDSYAIAELLLKATPLMLIGIGLAIGFRANVWNIGAEGQYLMGCIGASGVALFLPPDTNSFVMLTLMVIFGGILGALWAWIPAVLRTSFNANEILVSLMLVYVAQLLVSWLVHGYWQDPEGFNFPQSILFFDSALLPILIEDTRLNAAFILALVALVAGYFFMFRSFYGYQMQVAGQSGAAARYAGFSAKKTIWFGLMIGGAMAGVAGMSEVAGPTGQLTENIGSNYGFSAIIVAFVGRLHPVGIALGSLLMALLYLGGEQAQQYLGLPASIGMVFQGLLLFCLLGTDIFINYKLKWVGVQKS